MDSGAVLIDGVNVRTVAQTSLRKLAGVVAQDTVRQVSLFISLVTYWRRGFHAVY